MKYREKARLVAFKKNILIAIVLSVLIYPYQLFAKYSDTMVSGDQLLEYCNSDESTKLTFCYGYIGGVLDTLVSLAASDIIGRGVCLPEGVRLSEVKKIVVGYLETHPEELNLNASSLLIFDPFLKAYPCSE
jgi:hypothetical protein